MIILESQRDHYGFGGGLERHSSKSPPPFKDAVIVEKKNRDVDYTAKFTEERKGKKSKHDVNETESTEGAVD